MGDDKSVFLVFVKSGFFAVLALQKHSKTDLGCFAEINVYRYCFWCFLSQYLCSKIYCTGGSRPGGDSKKN